MNKYIAGLDIGTTKIACFIGERAESGKIRIVGYAKTDSAGVVHGTVMNIVDTARSITHAVYEAAEMAHTEVTEVYVGIAGQHIKSGSNRGSIMIPEDHPQIQASDIDLLIDNQYRILLGPGEDIIHVFPQDYYVDGQLLDPEIDPVGVSGKCLEANFHIVTGNTTNIRNIRDAIQQAGLIMKGVVLEPVASSYAVLNDLDRLAGVALVDIGGGTTDIAIFKDHHIRHSYVIPLAGNAITKDIQDSCQILKHQAESLKTRFGSCRPSTVSADEIISIPGIRSQTPREISVKTLANIIKARTEMILEQVGYEIGQSGYNRQLLAGITLTGGGSQLKNIQEFCELITGIDTHIGIPNENLETQGGVNIDEISHPMFATGIGLVFYGFQETERLEARNLNNQQADPTPESKSAPEVEEIEIADEQSDEKDSDQSKSHKRRSDRHFEDALRKWLDKFLSDKDLNE